MMIACPGAWAASVANDVVSLGVPDLCPGELTGVQGALDVGERLDRLRRSLRARGLVARLGSAAGSGAVLSVEHDDHLGLPAQVVAQARAQQSEKPENAGQVRGLVPAPDPGRKPVPGAEQQVVPVDEQKGHTCHICHTALTK